MTPIEVLKVLQSKIYEAKFYNTNYVLQKNDIEMITEALRIHDVVGQSEQLAAFLKWYYENDECPDLVTYEAAAERFLSR
jgi:hypothetical protein